VPDRIALRGLTARNRHGWFAHERGSQEFTVDVVLGATRGRAANDDLADTIDYGSLAERVVDVVAGNRSAGRDLAQRIADLYLDDMRVEDVEVTVHKPGTGAGALRRRGDDPEGRS
jgi:dihydroneopterin aldolase